MKIRKTPYLLLTLPWLGLIALARWFWSVRDALPARMAVHFDGQGTPNGWEAPMRFASSAVLLLLLLLVVFTSMGVLMVRLNRRLWWLTAICSDVASGSLLLVFWLLIKQNLSPGSRIMQQAQILPAIIIVAVVAMVLSTILGSLQHAPQREPHWSAPAESAPSNAGRVIAEESQAGRMWILLFAPLTVLFFYLALATRNLVLGLSAVVVFVVMLAAWSGFLYRFTTTGLEVRALGVRLKWVPLGEIKEYRAEPWNCISYGWRVARRFQAFIWSGHKGVRVRTWNGDVYLGHSEPERLLRDLDAMTKQC